MRRDSSLFISERFIMRVVKFAKELRIATRHKRKE